MKYDITLKTLLQKTPCRLLQMLVNNQPQEILTVEYPSVKDRRPDLVVRLVDGRLYQLELQTANDAMMSQRMLDYFALLLTTYQQEPFQNDFQQSLRYLYLQKYSLCQGCPMYHH